MDSKKITKEKIAPNKANSIVQDLTYVAILEDYNKDVSIPKPKGYRSEDFQCCCKNQFCKSTDKSSMVSKEMMMSYGKLPNHNYMINWPTEGNDSYLNVIEKTEKQREKALVRAKQHTLCFVYFLQHELGYHQLGLADDEFPTHDKLPIIPYYRESRRIHGIVRFILNDLTHPYLQPLPLYRTCIAVGDYPIDQHHHQYNGKIKLPDLHFQPIPSYGLPLGTLIPKGVDGLIVAEKSISVSNLVNGTTRLQPVVMQIGQAAGTLAALAVKGNTKIKDVSVRVVQNVILNANGYLLPYLDVPVNDPKFKPYQRIGSTGILKGRGKSVGWSNEMWFDADSLLKTSDLRGLIDYYPAVKQILSNYQDSHKLSINEALKILIATDHCTGLKNTQTAETMSTLKNLSKVYNIKSLNLNKKITKGVMAIFIDYFLDPFNKMPVDIYGRLIKKNESVYN